MKKILSILLMLLVVCSFVYAADDPTSPQTKTVKVTGTIEAGSGTEKGDNDVTFDGVNIAVAIAKDGDAYLTNNAPSSWSDSYQTVTTDTPVTVNLMKDEDPENPNPETFYIAVGVNGNPETEKAVTVKFEVDGWYKGKEASGTKVDSTIMTIFQDTTSISKPSEKVSVTASSSTSSDKNDTLKITHSAGRQGSKVLAGYSKIDWDVPGTPDAGDYTAQVKVTISEGT